jgi:phosphate-selective porin OprO/OprP
VTLATAAAAAFLAASPAAGVQATAPSSAPPAEGQADPFGLFDILDLDFSIGKRFRFRGYVQEDFAAYGQAPAGQLDEDFRRGGVGDPEADRARQLDDGWLLRRMRLGGEGTLGSNIAWRAMFEFGGGGEQDQARIAEVWAQWRGFKHYTVTIGAFPQLANMEGATSSDSLLFLERATPADLARDLGSGDGRVGVMLRRVEKTWMGALSLTGPVIDHSEDDAPRSAIVGRFIHTIPAPRGWNIVAGGSATYVLEGARRREEAAPGFPIRFQDQPEVNVDDTTLIDTGDIAADHTFELGLEAAVQRRNFYAQAEAFWFRVGRMNSQLADPHFFGFYLEGSWILTGEQRRFDRSRGAFWFPRPDRPVGHGGWGAWELALRYSRMNLNFDPGDPGAPPPPDGVRGGDQRIWSAGLNWYPRPRVRIMFQYMRVNVKRLNPADALQPEPFGPAPLTPPVGAQIGQAFNVFAARLRYSF